MCLDGKTAIPSAKVSICVDSHLTKSNLGDSLIWCMAWWSGWKEAGGLIGRARSENISLGLVQRVPGVETYKSCCRV